MHRMDHQARRVMAALSYKLFCISVILKNAVNWFVVSGSSKSLTRAKVPSSFCSEFVREPNLIGRSFYDNTLTA